MDALATLERLVDSGEIYFFGLFYPNVSPTTTREWIGSYESMVDRQQHFGPPAADFLSACENLCQLIQAAENRRLAYRRQAVANDFAKAELYISKLQSFIDERMDLGDPTWLLGLQYSVEGDPIDRWCGVMEGADWTCMQLSRCGSTLQQVSRELWDVMEGLDFC